AAVRRVQGIGVRPRSGPRRAGEVHADEIGLGESVGPPVTSPRLWSAVPWHRLLRKAAASRRTPKAGAPSDALEKYTSPRYGRRSGNPTRALRNQLTVGRG